jgi:hypothetical protein
VGRFICRAIFQGCFANSIYIEIPRMGGLCVFCVAKNLAHGWVNIEIRRGYSFKNRHSRRQLNNIVYIMKWIEDAAKGLFLGSILYVKMSISKCNF